MTIKSLPSGKMFLENIPDIIIMTARTRLAVTIAIGGKTIYEEFLYPADGEVVVSDLADIFRPYARQQLAVSATVTIIEQSVDGETETNVETRQATLQVYYASVDIVGVDCSSFLDNHFLTLLNSTKKTSEGRLEYLHYIGKDVASVKAYYKPHDAEGDEETRTFNATAVAGNDVYTTIDVSPSRFAVENLDLLYYEVEAGKRMLRFVNDPSKPDCAPCLLFTNSFGCQELIYCEGKHEVNPEYTRDAAYIGGLKTNYRITEQRNFNADTGYLNTDMANWADDLFRSDEVYIVNFIDGNPVVGKRITINSSTSKNDNLHDTLPRFTFSYVYSQRQHNVLDLQRGGRIFDNTFDNTFN